jgi:hypothetical protein
MTCCPERDAELDEAGRPSLFQYDDGCQCSHCVAMKMQRDSYTRWTFARTVKRLYRFETKLSAAGSLDEMISVQYDIAYMKDAIREGLQKWEGPAASPGMVN